MSYKANTFLFGSKTTKPVDDTREQLQTAVDSFDSKAWVLYDAEFDSIYLSTDIAGFNRPMTVVLGKFLEDTCSKT